MLKQFARSGFVMMFVLSITLIADALLPPSVIFAAEPVRISLEQAQELALQHNHALKAARSIILQNRAQEVTANLRPNPVLTWDMTNSPVSRTNQFKSSDYLNQTAQFDAGIGYTWELGGKRQRRLQAARDQTSVTESLVFDNERNLKFNVSAQFINVLLAQSNLDLANEKLKSFQNTVEISSNRFKAGDISEGDYLKIKLQLLQFLNDVNAARLAKVQSLVSLRVLLGYESVPGSYDVAGSLGYQPLKADSDAIIALAVKERPDLQAALRSVTSAQSQNELAKANSRKDITTTLNFQHAADNWTAGLFFSVPLAFFDRNQGEIARTGHVISQAQELTQSAREAVVGDVLGAYEGVRSNDEIVSLYRSGYLDNARESHVISEYAYKRGAASLLDFLDAERSYRATQLAYNQALASYMLSLEQLRQAAGVRQLP